MKKQMSFVFGAIAMLGMSSAMAATNIGARAASSADLTGGPATRDTANVNYEKYQTRTTTRTYDVVEDSNLYYTAPSQRSAMYKQYDSARTPNTMRTVTTTRSETVRREARRKYYLAHPFFQPLKGKFGSVTDLSYATNSYDISLTPVEGFSLSDTDAKWNTDQIRIKEDFSYGITDKIAVIGMAQFDSSDYKFDWKNSPDDKMDDSGLNMYGIGAQWRFVDNEEWIATASAYFQHQKDIANSFILDLKGGYKVARSTIYGLLRGWYVDFDGSSYGNGVSGKTAGGYDTALFVAYKTDVNDAFYIEGGLGVFSVLDEDWTLNIEGVFGDYDWHNQASLKAAIGWQPNSWFALNLYAKAAIYDSADDKTLGFWWNGVEEGDIVTYGWQHAGNAKIDNYSETTIGIQAIFQF